MVLRTLLVQICLLATLQFPRLARGNDMSSLKKDERVEDFRVSNLYSNSKGSIIGCKFQHIPTGAPIYVLQVESVPQVFMWIDAPASSNEGLAHAMEHLVGKGIKGRYVNLLRDMQLSQTVAATYQDLNFYGLESGAGMAGFFEQFHAWLDALYKPDFTNVEAENELYHFGVSRDSAGQRSLVEKGTVFDEMLPTQDRYDSYFALLRDALGPANPFGFDASGFPDEMRHVTPQEVRQFHAHYYRLGKGTGFIFVIPPRTRLLAFLRRVSHEFQEVPSTGNAPDGVVTGEPKYPIESSLNTEIGIYSFPGSSENNSGSIDFAWKPRKADSQTELRLLQLLFRALGQGEQSLLHASLIDHKTREMNTGASGVSATVFLGDSPFFPVFMIEVDGLSGAQVSSDNIEAVRSHILTKIAEISRYADRSPALTSFDKLVESYATAWRRSERVFTGSAPQFGSDYSAAWKEHLAYLEMDPSYVRSISDEGVWKNVEEELESGQNVWANVIRKFHLLDTPYATAARPSPRRRGEVERAKDKRLRQRLAELTSQFGTNDPQQALAGFEQEELKKTREIDKIASQVPRPKFTNTPPLTPDDEVRYRQMRVANVPVIATFFKGDPTIDVGFWFDLRKIPSRYYKYLPLLPLCVDSLGLRTAKQSVSYADLITKTHRDILNFSIAYDASAWSHRADLTLRASATTPAEFQTALTLIHQMLRFNDLELSNAGRLRDLVKERLRSDEEFTSDPTTGWFDNPAYVFRYQDDPLYLAVQSFFTRAHWDNRLWWRLHPAVSQPDIDRLGRIAMNRLAAAKGLSAKELAEELSKADDKGLEGELWKYWEKNMQAFPQTELIEGLRRLTQEVQEDLRIGPATTIKELEELQSLVFDKGALKIDLTLDEKSLGKVQPSLRQFVTALPLDQLQKQNDAAWEDKSAPISSRLEARYHLSGSHYPWYLGFADPHGVSSDMIFFADFPGYSHLDRKSLIRLLASKLISGPGPQTVFMKTWEDGLAYSSNIISEPNFRLIRYFADRSSDIPALIQLVNSLASEIPKLRDPSLIDYVFRQAFAVPRSMLPFSERGRDIARDIYDGNRPAKVRHFSRAVLKLRADPNLLSELSQVGISSINAVLLNQQYTEQQRAAKSIFFFYGSKKVLSEAEERLPIPRLMRIYPSDFWIDQDF